MKFPGSSVSQARFDSWGDFWARFGDPTTRPKVRADMLHLLASNDHSVSHLENDGLPWDDSVSVMTDVAREAIVRDKQRGPDILVEQQVWVKALRLALSSAHLDMSENNELDRGVQLKSWLGLLELIDDPWLYSDRPGFGKTEPLNSDIRKAMESGLARIKNKFGKHSGSDVHYAKEHLYRVIAMSDNGDLFLNQFADSSKGAFELGRWLKDFAIHNNIFVLDDWTNRPIKAVVREVRRKLVTAPQKNQRHLAILHAFTVLLIEADRGNWLQQTLEDF